MKDISMDGRYCSICGYTQEELEDNFKPWIEDLAQETSLADENPGRDLSLRVQDGVGRCGKSGRRP